MLNNSVPGKIYLDYSATTPLRAEVLKEMLPYLTEAFGNASSLSSLGVEAKRALEKARAEVAHSIGAEPDEIVFTSGGTESDNLAIQGIGVANLNRGNHILTSSIEHLAVLNPCRFMEKLGFRVTYLPVDRYGRVDPEEVIKRITSKTVLISVMHANNEIGTIQPVQEIGRMAQDRGIIFHTDAIQTVGKLPVDVRELHVDSLSISGHKVYGPKGVGALFVRKGIKISPLLFGGGQEKGIRSGTENVAGIVGLAKAIELAAAERESEAKREAGLREMLFKGLSERIEDIHLNGHPVHRLPGNLHLSFSGIDARKLIPALDERGIAVSRGSSCSSLQSHPSHVLKAIGLPNSLALGAVRITLGLHTIAADIERALNCLPGLIDEGRKAGIGKDVQDELFRERIEEAGRKEGCESVRQMAWSYVFKKVSKKIFRSARSANKI